MLNHYEILGVENTATPEKIRRAYHKLALQYHPDKGGSTKTFLPIQGAYEVLSDPEKKTHYDDREEKKTAQKAAAAEAAAACEGKIAEPKNSKKLRQYIKKSKFGKVKSLLAKNTDIHKQPISYHTGGEANLYPLNLAIRRYKKKPDEHLFSIIMLLIDQCDADDLNKASMDHDGYTPLHDAVSIEDESVANGLIHHLIEKGADPWRKSYTPLQEACKQGHLSTVNMLLEHMKRGQIIEDLGYNCLDHSIDDNLPPLHIAAKKGNEEVVKLLLENGANPEKTTSTNDAARNVATQAGHSNILSIFDQHAAAKIKEQAAQAAGDGASMAAGGGAASAQSASKTKPS
jgi:curved DNA-binding protein CbpA